MNFKDHHYQTRLFFQHNGGVDQEHRKTRLINEARFEIAEAIAVTHSEVDAGPLHSTLVVEGMFFNMDQFSKLINHIERSVLESRGIK